MKNINLFELGLIATCGVGAITGFVMSQTTQAYDLTQVKFCPKSSNTDQKFQVSLNKEFCNRSRYVLTEEWKKYGRFGGKIPYKGEAIQATASMPTDNPNQLAGGSMAMLSLWGATLTMYSRLQRIKNRDFAEREQEKTLGFVNWEDALHAREVKSHDRKLRTDRMKDGMSALDVETRIELGLTDTDQEQARGKIQLEDFLKNRLVSHSVADKTIAENLRDKAKADKERTKFEKPVQDKTISSDDEKDSKSQRVKELIQALKDHEGGWLWKIIDNLTPLWLIGKMGSGKTWTASAIALVRQQCLDSQVHLLMDRHATGDNANVWKFLNPQLVAEDEEQISSRMIKCIEHWILRIKGKDDQEKPYPKGQMGLEQVIVDEYTNLKELIKDVPDTWYKLHLSDPRKALSQVIGITHNDTNASYPANTHSSREDSTILIKKYSANGKTPLPRVTVVRGLVDDAGNELPGFEGTIPSWLMPQTIYDHFNGKPINFERED